jgi:predicted TIM-barrel enzyme/protein-tyrosine-phosphatase
MDRFRETFHCPHAVLPVVHLGDARQALRNAGIAYDAGCDGVFLINHSVDFASLLAIHREVAAAFQGWWIGVNCLDLDPHEVFAQLPPSVGGVWVDNAFIEEAREEQPAAEAIDAARRHSGWEGLYFGGVAFKYQRPVYELEAAARRAARFMDVVTTSGTGTGIAAQLEKIRAMKSALGTHPLAIASGITPENVHQYLPLADSFLVATGVSRDGGRDFWHFDPDRVAALVSTVRSWPGVSAPPIGSVCFVCEWNEGRSVHLELSTRRLLRERDLPVTVMSAGLRPGGGINALRARYLAQHGIPLEEIHAHSSTVFALRHSQADLVLVTELWMKQTLLDAWPELRGRVVTVRGFLRGFCPGTETITEDDARIVDAGGHTDQEKLALYAELDSLAGQIVERLAARPRP